VASLRFGVISNMLGQAYVALIGLVMVPMYIRFMGVEAYGLISFFVALQTWFALLDMGISPTLVREVACFRAGSTSGASIWKFVRSAEWLFLAFGVLSLVIVAATSHWLAQDWLKLQKIGVADVQACIVMMGVMLGGRWLASLYRSGLVGMMMLPVVNLASVLLATFRSVLVVAVLMWFSTDCKVFFAYQTVIALAELIILATIFYRAIPGGRQARVGVDFSALKPVFRFAGAMAMLSVIWGVVGQVDRLVLSHSLNLATYGGYAVATVAASGVTLLATPFLQALQPRFVYLAERLDEAGLLDLYRLATQVLMLLLTVTAGTAIFLGGKLLWIWTGNQLISEQQAIVVVLYAAGNAMLALSSLIFQLQYARGDIRLHVRGSLCISVVWIPLIVWGAWQYGGKGAGTIWFLGNLLYFAVWMVRIQRRMLPQLKWQDWLRDLAWIPLAALPIFLAGTFVMPAIRNRWEGLILVILIAGMALMAGCGASATLRRIAREFLRKFMCAVRLY
jgi:O-antigen/teichoic acid export membrane protein